MAATRLLIQELQLAHPGAALLLGGDVNAALFPQDRRSNIKGTDRRYAEWVASLGLVALQATQRPHTYFPHADRLSESEGTSSRIDDWLVQGTRSELCHPCPLRCTVGFEHKSDHEPLTLRVGVVGFSPTPEQPPEPRPRRVAAPFTPEMRGALRRTLEFETQKHIGPLRMATDPSATADLAPALSLTHAAQAVDKLLAAAQVTVLDTVGEALPDTARQPRVGVRPHQRGHIEPRSARDFKKAELRVSKARAAIRGVLSLNLEFLTPPYPATLVEYGALCPEFAKGNPARQGAPATEWVQALEAEIATAKKDRKRIERRHDWKQQLRLSRVRDDALRYNTKNEHRKLFGTAQERHTLSSVSMPDGSVSAAPADVLATTEAYFRNVTAPTIPGHDAGAPPPWSEAPNADPLTRDHFTLPNLQDRYPEKASVGSLYSRTMYYRELSRLAGKKAPGNDGILNETLKHMPEDFHDCVHKIFVDMWRQRRTPDHWKTALTVLLYKKDDPTQVKNYRPIGLLPAIYKLWTAIVTRCLTMFVEHHNLLSDAQEGFRGGKNTVRQIHRLIMALEDASHSGSPIYVLYVDFVNAFGAVDHRRMAHILKMQGYPEDIVDVVHDLYCGAGTVVRTPAGETQRVENLGKGTVQGDPLSPLLFIIAMDPLLRWLQQGSRGYSFTTSASSLTSPAYADDLALAAGSMADLTIQARKVEAYCKWAGFEVNVDKQRKNKTAWTGPKLSRWEEQELTLLGQVVPRLAPDEPYVYLGVHITLNLNWSHHTTALRTKMEQRLAVIENMRHTPELVMRTLETVVRSMARYSMPLGVFSWEALTKLNQKFWKAAKRIVGLSSKASNHAMLRKRNELGAGVDPLHLTYAVAALEQIQTLRHSQEDLGTMWRGLVAEYQRSHPAGNIPHLPSYRLQRPTLNAVAQLRDLGVTWCQDTGMPGAPTSEDAGPSDLLYDILCSRNAAIKAAGEKPLSLRPLVHLWSVGVHSIHDVTGRDHLGAPKFLSTAELRRKHPEKLIRAKHGRAVTLLARALPPNTLPLPQGASIADTGGWTRVPNPGPDPATTWPPSRPEGTVYTVAVGKPAKRSRRSARTYHRPHAPPGSSGHLFEVDDVIAEEYRMGTRQFLVQYSGYPVPEWTRPCSLEAEDSMERDLHDFKLRNGEVASNLRASADRPLVGKTVDVLIHEPQNLDRDRPCVVCDSPHDTLVDDILVCEGCDSYFHSRCHSPPVLEVPDGEWRCHACTDPSAPPAPPHSHRYEGTVYRNLDSRYLAYPYVVRFPPSSNLLPIFTDMRHNNHRLGDPSDRAQGVRLKNEIKLRDPPPDGAAEARRRRDAVAAAADSIRKRIDAGDIVISDTESNPYRDIRSTGSFELRRQQLHGAEVVHTYDKRGKWKGMVHARRFTFLRERWLAFWKTAGSVDLTTWKPLAWELSDLFDRHKPGAKKGGEGKVNLRNYWTTPDELRHVIFENFGVLEESFSSPLNCLMVEYGDYCTAHERDRVFGAKFDAYAHSKKGLSIYMNPEYELEELHKALKWAVAASQAPEPFCAVLVLPRFQMASYMKLFSHHNVSLIAKLRKHTFAFMPPDQWETEPTDPSALPAAKFLVLIVEVANRLGQSLHIQGPRSARGCLRCRSGGGRHPGDGAR